jgi:hypothetical protein
MQIPVKVSAVRFNKPLIIKFLSIHTASAQRLTTNAARGNMFHLARKNP